ncbi:MAG: DNA-directed RNA polymerase subunit omega [Bacilli bacterium]|nr:DNA-directed RNA polymerase subunit omega [Bacilli bacterium]MBQ8902393.1 DNA-directed RNA polymerase subunit omega [Bacilli bacterium]
MLYPSIDKLLNIVDSKYMLVHVASKRSKQMLETSHYQMRISNYISKKDIGKSLEELENGLIKVVKK